MGIDVYAKWDGQTDDDRKAQITGFSIVHGHTGYLREAYHGDPYATKVLFPECWDDVLVEDQGIRAPMEREDLDWFCKQNDVTFEEVHKRSSEMLAKLREYFGEHYQVEWDSETNRFTWNTGAMAIPAATLRERLPDAIEATKTRYKGDQYQGAAVASVIKFVELYEKLDAEGKNPRVYVSY